MPAPARPRAGVLSKCFDPVACERSDTDCSRALGRDDDSSRVFVRDACERSHYARVTLPIRFSTQRAVPKIFEVVDRALA